MLRRITALLLLTLTLLTCLPARAELERSALLDAALSMLEEGNPFLERYNELTGAEVEAVFPLGAPYFFGGKHDYNVSGEPLLFSRAPEYAKRKMWEQTHFYDKDKEYLYGFDCSGFTNWVYTEVGWEEHPALDQMILNYGKYGKKNHLFSHRDGQEMPAWDELADALEVGDLLVGKKGARHVLMFIGTLRDFGYTEEEVPELAPYLDYALVIHCGPNPTYGPRIQEYLDAHADDPYYANVMTTNGGVAVSIIGVPVEDAPCHGTADEEEYAWFELPDGAALTIWDLPACTSFCWFRWGTV